METNRNLEEVSNVSFYGSRSQEGHISNIWELMQALKNNGINVNVEKKLASVLSDQGYRLSVHGIKVCNRIPEDTQIAISVGGDGTFLRTARWIEGKEIPILGINTGHLGFLTENSAENIEDIVAIILSGNPEIEKRLVLKVECAGLAPSEWPYALNEVTLLKGNASMIDINVEIDGFYLASYRADGLIISTPTGSTAYNLSVGGPILAPTLDSMVLSPIAPHTLTLRPVVIGGNSEVLAKAESRAQDFRLSIDGRSVSLPCGIPIKIKKAPHKVLTIRKPGENFASTLREKLLWGH